ncbi:MAG: hypothetical protein Q4F83_13255 [Eubacteriales bacterium]|nr:hypothetical protein [Eubacteriales bacterium]
MDYQVYRFSIKELAENISLFLLLDTAVSCLFYRSWAAFLTGLLLCPFFLKYRREVYKKKRQQQLSEQFLEGMKAVAVSLGAGYSIETAFEDALGELKNIYNQELICKGWFLHPNTYDCGSFVVN